MTVRELISELLNFPMDAKVTKRYLVLDREEEGYNERHEEPEPDFIEWSDGTYSVTL